MPRQSIFAGDTDYMGMDLPCLTETLVATRDMLVENSGALQQAAQQVESMREALAGAEEIHAYALRFSIKFNEYADEIDPILTELQRGARTRHVAALHELHAHSRRADGECVAFKHEHAYLYAPERHIVQTIYERSRQPLFNILDLDGLAARLAVFVEEPGERAPREELISSTIQLGPVAVNLKALLGRLHDAVKTRLFRKWLPPNGK